MLVLMLDGCFFQIDEQIDDRLRCKHRDVAGESIFKDASTDGQEFQTLAP